MAFDSLSQIVTEKIDKKNFQAWKFRMTNFLMGKGVWLFINGDEDPFLFINGDEQEPVLGAALTIVVLNTFKEWHEKSKKVMYWLSASVLVVVHENKTNINNRKTSPMKEDMVTLEAGEAKEDVVHGKETNR